MFSSIKQNSNRKAKGPLKIFKSFQYDSPNQFEDSYSNLKIPIKILPTKLFDLNTYDSNSNKNNSKKSTPRKTQSTTPSLLNKSFENKKIKKIKFKRNKSINTSVDVVDKKKLNVKSVPNFELELEKLLRALFRHCVVCPEFKNELSRVSADTLLNLYANNRLQFLN